MVGERERGRVSEQELNSYIVVISTQRHGTRARVDVQLFDPENPDKIKEPISTGYYISYGSVPDVGQAVRRAFDNLTRKRVN